MMILNERILRLFVTLAEELHFGRAAARLHLSQPALSGTVKSLEADFGIRLFKRTSRHVELTDAGQVLVAEARRLIAESERVVALVRGTSSDVFGPLRVGYPASIDVHWLCSLVSRARRDGTASPALQLVSAEAIELEEELLRGNLHAAFLVGQLSHPDLQCKTISREPLALVMNAKHSMTHTLPVQLNQLQDESVVWLRRDLNPLLHERFLAMCSSQNYRPNIVQEVRTFHECAEFAAEALGITFLPAYMQAHCRTLPIVFAGISGSALHTEVMLAYRRNDVSPGLERFVRFVQDFVLPGSRGMRAWSSDDPSAPSMEMPKQTIGLAR